ncbi:DnaA ATPase domain-containing protein [Ureaplasma canigenitalium]|uniref:DnaA ATPase domain-containing protein n=1 Tax=Ureaplasma canigenitalium TaxID=42092 RepID=UPI0004E21489|nr:DnaA/Hda family protein [Ureaplasma canigenitalium]
MVDKKIFSLFETAYKNISFNLLDSEVWTILKAIQPQNLEFNDGVLTIVVAKKLDEMILKDANTFYILKKKIIETFSKNEISIANITIIDQNNLLLVKTGYLSPESKNEHKINGFTNKLLEHNFDNFVVTDYNKFVVGTVQKMFDKSNRFYKNQVLFIHGPVGVGKTHLICAVGNEYHKNNPKNLVYYIEANDFTNRFIKASGTSSSAVEDFKQELMKADLLIIDDIQNLKQRETFANLFFTIFNEITKKNDGKIIITADRPHLELKGLTDRLVSRLGSGFFTTMGSPSIDDAKSIIKQWIKHQSTKTFTDDAIDLVANYYHKDIRQMISFLENTLLWSELDETEQIDKTFIIKKASEQNLILGINDVENITPEYYLEQIAKMTNIKVESFKSDSRKADIVFARNILVYVLSEKLKLTLQDIGSFLGGRRHTTIMHAKNQVVELLKNGGEDGKIVAEIIAKLN